MISGAGCNHNDTIILPSDQRIFVIKEGAPEFDGVPFPYSEIEGYYVIAPGNMLEYLKWARRMQDEAEAGTLDAD